MLQARWFVAFLLWFLNFLSLDSLTQGYVPLEVNQMVFGGKYIIQDLCFHAVHPKYTQNFQPYQGLSGQTQQDKKAM